MTRSLTLLSSPTLSRDEWFADVDFFGMARRFFWVRYVDVGVVECLC